MTSSKTIDIKSFIDARPIAPYQWLLVALCFLVVAADGMDVAIMGFVAPSIIADWGISRPAFGLVMSAAPIGLVIGALAAGPASDKIGRKWVLITSVFLFGVFTIATAFTHSPTSMAILRLLTGIGLGAAMPNTTTLLSEYAPQRKRSLMITIMFTGFNLGSALIGFVAGWLIPVHGWRAVLLVGGALPLALIPLQIWLLPESARLLAVRGATSKRIGAVLGRVCGERFAGNEVFVSNEPPLPTRKPIGVLFSQGYGVMTATDAKRLPKLLEMLSPAERRWAQSSGFTGAANSFHPIVDAKGSLTRVLAGVRDAADPWALAALPLKLPRGRYELGKGAVTIAPDNAAFAWDLGGYQFTRYRRAARKPADLQLDGSARVKDALGMAQAVRLVRDMVNTPAEDMGPEHLSDLAREQAELFGGEFDEWVGEELLAQNFPAIHAVGRAASRAPRLLEIHWGNPKHPRIAIVGKGVCFDTGGLDLKTAEGMRLMKKDMGGAAHALALARLIMQRQLPVNLHLVIPAVENAVSGNAFRPGDVVRTRKGLTVEIGNTDAEGRVILCDALAYAAEQKPKTIIDFATLTGAARVALGPELPVLYANDDKLAARLLEAGTALDDPLWRLPLWRNYRRFFDSDVADINNAGRGGFGGSIVAALFLEYFVPEDISWAHFDVFSWNDASRPGRPLGGEAQGLRAVLAAIA